MSSIYSMKKLEQMDIYRRNFILDSIIESSFNFTGKLVVSKALLTLTLCKFNRIKAAMMSMESTGHIVTKTV